MHKYKWHAETVWDTSVLNLPEILKINDPYYFQKQYMLTKYHKSIQFG